MRKQDKENMEEKGRYLLYILYNTLADNCNYACMYKFLFQG